MKFINLAKNRFIKADEIVSVRFIEPTKDDDNYYIRVRSNHLTWQQNYTNEKDAESCLDHIMSMLQNL